MTTRPKQALLITILIVSFPGVFWLGYKAFLTWGGHGILSGAIPHVSFGTRSATIAKPDENSPSVTPPPVTMLFAGDIMLSRSVGGLMRKLNDYNYPFEKISNFIKNADIAFANLENPVSSRGIKSGSQYSFRADSKVMSGLKNAGFDVLSVANNHIWDYGREAFADTLRNVKENDMDFIGGGNNFKEAHDGLIKNINGTRVAFLAYTDLLSPRIAATADSAGVSFLDMGQMKTDIQNAKAKSDIVAVSFHWGDEYQASHNQKQEKIAKIAIDAGASLIVGHHPHVAQELEKYKDGWIAYSLGNFIFDQNFSAQTMKGLVLEVKMADKKIKGVVGKNISISRSYQPEISD